MNGLKYRSELEYQVLGLCLDGHFPSCHNILVAKNFRLGGLIKHEKIWTVMDEMVPTMVPDIVNVSLAIQRKYGVNVKSYLVELSNAVLTNTPRTLAVALLEFDIRQVLIKTLNECLISLQESGLNSYLIDITSMKASVFNCEFDFFETLDSIRNYLRNNEGIEQLNVIARVVELVPRRINSITKWEKMRSAIHYLRSVDFEELQSTIDELAYHIEYFIKRKGVRSGDS